MQDNLLNSFAQTKGLLWSDWYESIVKWETGKSDYLKPPVGAAIDLTTTCNLFCKHCLGTHSRKLGLTLDTSEVIKIIDLLNDWGVKSVCFAGGGEPTIHKDFHEIISHAGASNMEVGMSTNGLMLKNDKVRNSIVKNARFCGVSVDAAKAETWGISKNVNPDLFYDLIKGCVKTINDIKGAENINGIPLDFVFKFLINFENQYEIYDACKLAKDIGFKTFFARPVAFEKTSAYGGDSGGVFNIPIIKSQVKRCQGLISDDFKVYTSFNRVDSEFRRTFNFNKCHSTPLMITICADGYWYSCIDHRYHEGFRMCHWSKILDYWGGGEHRDFVNSIDLSKCSRCAGGNYNEQIEKCIIKDNLFKWFP